MTELSESLQTLSRLIAFPSVSSQSNAAVSDCVGQLLSDLGFEVQLSQYVDDRGVVKVNVLARRDPLQAPTRSGVAYFCHTDVVPAEGWTGPGGDPFDAVSSDDRIYGRGSCDMKGSLVTMLTAVSRRSRAQQQGPIWIVCTADEEVGFEGARHLVAESEGYREIVQAQPAVVIGEPTRLNVVHAHKGIAGFQIISHGVAAHSSTTDGVNANEAMVPMLQTLLKMSQLTKSEARYQDSRFDPPLLSWNFGVSDSSTAINITPERSVAWACFRSMPGIDGEDLIDTVRQRADELGLEFRHMGGGKPVWVDPDSEFIQKLCELVGGPAKTVCYGTDGGEFFELKNLCVLGPGDIAQAHTTDEFLRFEQLRRGIDIYERLLRHWA